MRTHAGDIQGGSRFLATFLDDCSKLSVVQPIKDKSDVTSVTEHVFAQLELQTGKKVKAVQNGPGRGVRQRVDDEFPWEARDGAPKTAGYSPEQNGAAERLNLILEQRGKALLEDSELGPEWWAEAMVTANYTRNRVPSRVHGKTPFEMFHGEKPNLSNLRVFGARAYLHPRPEGEPEEDGAGEREGVVLGL